MDRLELERIEVQLLAGIVQLGLRQAAAFLGSVEQRTQFIAEKQDVRGHASWVLASQ